MKRLLYPAALVFGAYTFGFFANEASQSPQQSIEVAEAAPEKKRPHVSNFLGEMVRQASVNFRLMPAEKQQEVLNDLESFVIEETSFGPGLKRLGKFQIPIVVDPSLERGNLAYDIFQDRIARAPSTPLEEFISYFDDPLVLREAHEKLHAMQDRTTPRHAFEEYLQKYILAVDQRGYYVPQGLHFTREHFDVFAKEFLKAPAPDDEVKRAFIQLYTQYKNAEEDRLLLRETQAYLAFRPHMSPFSLQDKIGRQIPNLEIAKVEMAHNLVTKLHGIADPVEAAMFTGTYGENFHDFDLAIRNMAQDRNIENPYTKGLERNMRASEDLKLIMRTAFDKVGIE